MLSTFRQLVEEYSELLQVDTLMVRQEIKILQSEVTWRDGSQLLMEGVVRERTAIGSVTNTFYC